MFKLSTVLLFYEHLSHVKVKHDNMMRHFFTFLAVSTIHTKQQNYMLIYPSHF